MIPRFLVPFNSRPPAVEDGATSRRRPTALDERTLVPAMLPITALETVTKISSSLPLESVLARLLVPRDLRPEAYDVTENHDAPLQPTELDARIAVPQGAAPPIVEARSLNLPLDLVEGDVMVTGEVNLLSKEMDKARAPEDLVRTISSVVLHILIIAAIILQPKLFPRRVRSPEEEEIARRQISILLPPGALEAPRNVPRPKQPQSEAMRVDPRVLRKIAPPEPQPGPKEPERVVKELPNAPVPQPAAEQPAPQPSAPTPKNDAPKPPIRLETPEEAPRPSTLVLPKNSPGGSLQDSIREAAKMNAPSAIGGGGQLPSTAPGGGGQGAAYGAMTLLTPTEGVDFSNYLARVYASVKQNWFAVMPSSVSLGDKGVVVLRFRIMKNGSVPTGEPVRVRGSGKEPLDRAAVSSVRASNPFEPLPSAFHGDYIELQFAYYYNLQPDYAH